MRDLLRASVETDRALAAKGTLYDFLQMAWPLIDPAPFVGNWHLEEKCAHLEAVSRGEIRNLVINEPPGMGKSNVVNVVWNAWEWIFRPGTKFALASFDVSLVGTRDGMKVIQLLQSDWFRARWGDLLMPGKPATSMFQTRAGGFRFATSPKGKGTGRHADIRILDDPLKPQDAAGGGMQTRNALRSISEWLKNTWSSRATDQRTTRDVLIMQRLHEEDPAGEILAKGNCVNLRFPMEYEASDPCITPWGGDRRKVEGELLFPERFPADVVQFLKTDKMGPDVYAAQCQQRPTKKGGGVFRRDWWRFWHHRPGVPAPCLCDTCFPLKRTVPGCGKNTLLTCEELPIHDGWETQSWDCTFKKSDTTDFVAGMVFRYHTNRIFALDCVNERMRFTETLDRIRALSMKWPRAYDKLVEDKANGPAVEDVLRNEIPGITLVNPQGGKEARANAGSIYFAAGRFYLPHPELAPWVYPFIVQHETFPKGVNDDMVDATSQFLVRLRAHGESFVQAMARLRGDQ